MQKIMKKKKKKKDNIKRNKSLGNPRNATIITSTEEHDMKKIEPKSFSELAKHGSQLSTPKKIFGNYILEGDTVLLAAERGAGKTFLGLQIALVVSDSEITDFLGEKVESHGNTLYINLEMGEDVISRRLSKLTKGKNLQENKFKPDAINYQGNIKDIIPKIEAYLKKRETKLIIIDNLRAAFSGKDNEKNKEMTEAVSELNTLKERHKCTIVLAHHTKKGTSHLLTNSDLQSGAGAISDLVDADFFIRKCTDQPNLRILKRIKSRNCEEQDSTKLIKLDKDTLWFNAIKEDVNERDYIYDPNKRTGRQYFDRNLIMKKLHDIHKLTFEEIGSVFGINKSNVSRGINKVGGKVACCALHE